MLLDEIKRNDGNKSLEQNEIDELKKDINTIDENNISGQGKITLIKLRAFITKLGSTEKEISTTLDTIKNGVSLFRRLAKNYNAVAQWVGLPQIPNVFFAKKK